MHVLIYTKCHAGLASSYLAGENLLRCAKAMGWNVQAEIHSQLGSATPFTAEEIDAADLIVVAAVVGSDLSRFRGKKLFRADMHAAINNPDVCLREAQESATPYQGSDETLANNLKRPLNSNALDQKERGGLNILAVTACPTGVAHTFMAAEALQSCAEQMGHQIQVETRGSIGAKDTFSAEQIARSDLIILAVDIEVDASLFAGKRIYRTSTGRALRQPRVVIEEAIVGAKIEEQNSQSTVPASQEKPSVYKHLMTGVSYMLPIVVAGGLTIALSFVFGIDAFKQPGTLAAALMKIGGDSAFALMIPVLSGYIAFSIADRPGLAPGLIGGMLASALGAGFLGGIVSGFLAGYTAKVLIEQIQLPRTMDALKPILIIPLVASLITGLVMIYIVGGPVASIMKGLENFLSSMGDANAVLLGLLLGAMMCFDLGGPVNKAAYAFGVGLLASKQYEPMAAIMAAGMTPAIAMGLATRFGGEHFSQPEREAGKASLVLGLCFISEGAIPFAAKDPLRVIPSAMIGGAVTGGLSMHFNITLMAPHGGLFVLFIPNAISNPLTYAGIIGIGSVVTATIYLVLMRIIKHKEVEIEQV